MLLVYLFHINFINRSRYVSPYLNLSHWKFNSSHIWQISSQWQLGRQYLSFWKLKYSLYIIGAKYKIFRRAHKGNGFLMNNGIHLINFTEKPTLLLSNINFKHCQWKLDKHATYLRELSLDAQYNLFFTFLVKDKVFSLYSL